MNGVPHVSPFLRDVGIQIANAMKWVEKCAVRKGVLLISLLCLCSQAGNADERDDCRGREFGAVELQGDQQVPSPDKKYSVVLGGYNENNESGRGWLRVFQGRKLLSRFTLKHLSAGIWLNWAPDSNAFFLMWSDGGAIGNFHVRVFRIRNDRVVELPTMKIAEAEFATEHYCRSRRNNSLALRWPNGSDSLVIATGVYPTSDCGKDLGFTIAYVVRTDDGKIIKRYSQTQTETLMKTCSPFMD